MLGVKNPMPGVVYPSAEALQRYAQNGPLKEVTLAEAFMEAFAKWPKKTAVSTPEGQMSYEELDRDSDCFAAALMDLGLDPLDRVVFQVVNSLEIVIAIVACWKANLIPVCTLAAHRDAEISYLAKHAGARAHFIGIDDRFDFVGFAKSIAAKTPTLEHIVVVRGEAPNDLPSMAHMIAAQSPEAARARVEAVERDPYQVGMFQLSGGTTSIPKIIPRFNNEYVYNMDAFADWVGFDEDTVSFMPLQVIHNAAMVCTFFPALLRGGEAVTTQGADPATVFSLIQQRKPTDFGVMGAALSKMQQINAKDLLPLEQVRAVSSPNAARKTEEVLGVTGVHLFGMTEGLITWGRAEDPEEARLNTIGQPISSWDEVKIVDPDGETELPDGEIGEMVSRGPYTFCGYYDAEERNREVFTSDGFYRSGDLMAKRHIDGKVYLSYEGRLKDLINRGGEKINCEEVENVARLHPGIGDVQIVAMPDPDYGERACAFIIPSGAENTPDTKELMEFLVGQGLAKFKCPERIVVIDDFPVTDSQKISKPKMREMIRNILEDEGATAA